ncbi:MAG: DUF2225 domain-containing protein [Bacteroidota bacterium]
METTDKKLTSRPLQCPACESQFTLYTPLSRSYQMLERDSDFCPHYQGVNPLFYQVWVCPSCSFAAYKEHWKELPTNERIAMLQLSKESLGMRFDFSRPERTLFAGLLSYKLAYRCYQKRRVANPYLMAHLQLKLAWLCRLGHDLKRERIHLETALVHFIEAYERECGKQSPGKLAYLIGEISRRTGRPEDAGRWFTKAAELENQGEIYRLCKNGLFEAKEGIRLLRFLRGVDFFKALELDQLALLSGHLASRRFASGATICTKGEPGQSLFIITQGGVKVLLEPKAPPVAVLRAGEFFGEMSLLTGRPRSATVIATEQTEALEIDKLSIRTLLAYNQEIAGVISGVIEQRQATNEQVQREGYPVELKEEGKEDGFLGRIRHYFELDR